MFLIFIQDSAVPADIPNFLLDPRLVVQLQEEAEV